MQFGWDKTKENFWFLFLTLIIVLIASGATGKIPFVGIIVGILASISIITVALEIVDGKKPIFKDLFKKYSDWKIFVNYILASILTALAVVVGLILLIVPGIYLAIRLQFYKYLIVDKGDIGPVDAIKESWRMTEGETWNLFLFLILIALLNIAGALLLGIGLFATIPITLLSYGLLYRKLHARLSLVKSK
mgnify:FL=1